MKSSKKIMLAAAVLLLAAALFVGAGAATYSGDVTLTGNVELTAHEEITTNTTINGAGFTISAADDFTTVGNDALFIVKNGATLTLNNVKIDAKSKARAVKVESGSLIVNQGTQITGGKTVATDSNGFIGGVYITGTSTITVNDGIITGNTNGNPAYNSDGYLQYAKDLWIGSQAHGYINGGTIGSVFVNANDFSDPQSGLTMTAGTVAEVYLECDRTNCGVFEKQGGQVTTLYIAADDAQGGTHTAPKTTIPSPANGDYAGLIPAAAPVKLEKADGGIKYFATLAEAIAASTAVTTGNADTITLLKDITNQPGISVSSGKNFILDFNGKTVTFKNPAAGSTGTQNQALQLLKNSKIVFKDGTINLDPSNPEQAVADKPISRIIQNYANLTLENMTLDGTNLHADYKASAPNRPSVAVAFNNGTVSLTGSTSIKAMSGGYAFEVDWWPTSYPAGTQVTVNTTGTINGDIRFIRDDDGVSTEGILNTLDITQGNFVGTIKVTKEADGTADEEYDTKSVEKVAVKPTSATAVKFSVLSDADKARVEKYSTHAAYQPVVVTTGQTTTLTLNIEESYTINIPASFNFTKDLGAETYSTSSDGVGVDTVNVADGHKVAITLVETLNDFKLKAGNKTIRYGSTFDNQQIVKGTAFCTTTDNTHPKTGTLKFTTSNGTTPISITGNFTDTVTFKAAIVEAA